MSIPHTSPDYWGKDLNEAVWKPIHRGETMYLGSRNRDLLLERPKGPFGVEMKIAKNVEFFFLWNQFLMFSCGFLFLRCSGNFSSPLHFLPEGRFKLTSYLQTLHGYIPNVNVFYLYTLAKIHPTHLIGFSLVTNAVIYVKSFHKIWSMIKMWDSFTENNRTLDTDMVQ